MMEIGGYFELELSYSNEYHENGIKLNSARNCLRQLIATHKIRKIYVPAFTCPVVWDAIKKEDCEMVFYRLDDKMMPEVDLDSQEWVLYTNYFGVCDKNIIEMKRRYPKLIVDQAQAFYGPVTENCFFSPRKFFGVPDGGIVYSSESAKVCLEQSESAGRMLHLLQRIETGASYSYQTFLRNEEELGREPLKKMSLLTSRLLHSINYEKVKNVRKSNFNYIHQSLKDRNEFIIDEESFAVAMVYPYLVKNGSEIKKRLIESNIYVATYWKGQQDTGIGHELEERLVAIPIDQRYSTVELQRVLQIIN
ncbi:MAG: hypothetical protein ACI4FZ_04925 [Lachnospiraceae bacterium]